MTVTFFFFFLPPLSVLNSASGHGGRAGEQRRVRSCQGGERGLAAALRRSGDAAPQVPDPGGENQRAAGGEGKIPGFRVEPFWAQSNPLFFLVLSIKNVVLSPGFQHPALFHCAIIDVSTQMMSF